MPRPKRPAATLLALAAISAAGIAAPNPSAPPARPELAGGYLPQASLPDSLALLPPPPAPGSAAFARDEEASKAMARPASSPRFSRAFSDAQLALPQLTEVFSCAMGMSINPDFSPTLYKLMQRSLIDIGLSTYKAKNQYQRTRPFVMHRNASCTPKDEALLSKDGSYPSGHSAIGWGWALILAELNPTHADAILQRGRDFGQSRLVCNVHWQSDVDAGRVIAAATVARLHADPAFEADLEKARAEVQSATGSGARPVGDCAAEAASLSD